MVILDLKHYIPDENAMCFFKLFYNAHNTLSTSIFILKI
jgi:hypothetical protein